MIQPSDASGAGGFGFPGGEAVPIDRGDRPEPVTAETAAVKLQKTTTTIRTWVTRFNARRLGRVGRTMFYDMRDLRVIEREIDHGHKVPPTPEEREAIRLRCPLRAAEREAETQRAA